MISMVENRSLFTGKTTKRPQKISDRRFMKKDSTWKSSLSKNLRMFLPPFGFKKIFLKPKGSLSKRWLNISSGWKKSIWQSVKI